MNGLWTKRDGLWSRPVDRYDPGGPVEFASPMRARWDNFRVHAYCDWHHLLQGLCLMAFAPTVVTTTALVNPIRELRRRVEVGGGGWNDPQGRITLWRYCSPLNINWWRRFAYGGGIMCLTRRKRAA